MCLGVIKPKNEFAKIAEEYRKTTKKFLCDYCMAMYVLSIQQILIISSESLQSISGVNLKSTPTTKQQFLK